MDKEPMFPQTDVRQFLMAVEPDYDKAAQLGLAILPELDDMIEKNEPQLTPRAAYLVGMLASQNDEALPKILELLNKAAHSDLPTVRIAVAATAEHLPTEHAVPLLRLLLQDEDLSVRKFALTSAPLNSPPELVKLIEERAQTEELPEMRALAQEVLASMKQQ